MTTSGWRERLEEARERHLCNALNLEQDITPGEANEDTYRRRVVELRQERADIDVALKTIDTLTEALGRTTDILANRINWRDHEAQATVDNNRAAISHLNGSGWTVRP